MGFGHRPLTPSYMLLGMLRYNHISAETRTGPGCCSIRPVRVFCLRLPFHHLYPKLMTFTPKDIDNHNYKKTIDLPATALRTTDNAARFSMSAQSVFDDSVPPGPYIEKSEKSSVFSDFPNSFLGFFVWKTASYLRKFTSFLKNSASFLCKAASFLLEAASFLRYPVFSLKTRIFAKKARLAKAQKYVGIPTQIEILEALILSIRNHLGVQS